MTTRRAIRISLPSGAHLTVDLDRIPSPRPSFSSEYNRYRISTGPVFHGIYLGVIHREDQSVTVVGPSANAATARFLARQWIDQAVAAGTGVTSPDVATPSSSQQDGQFASASAGGSFDV